MNNHDNGTGSQATSAPSAGDVGSDGEDHPAPFGKLRDPERCVVGEEIRVVDVGRYVVVDVEPETVWIQREMH